jgi:hypothetical protein
MTMPAAQWLFYQESAMDTYLHHQARQALRMTAAYRSGDMRHMRIVYQERAGGTEDVYCNL